MTDQTRVSTAPPARWRWTVAEIVTAAVVAAATGVLFWAWGWVASLASVPLSLSYPPARSVFEGGWLVAAVLVPLVVRKPGAAVFGELVAAAVSMLLGAQWGFAVLQWGLLQGLGAELVFALFAYRRFGLGVSMLAGAGAAAGGAVLYQLLDYAAWSWDHRMASLAISLASGAVVAGAGSWLLARRLPAAALPRG